MSARRSRRARAETAPVEPTGFQPISRPYSPIDVLSAEQEDRVHALSLDV